MRGSGVGSGQEMITIEMVTEDAVHALNSIGARRVIPLAMSRGKGFLPVEGETWIIDRDLGEWTLSMCLAPASQPISGTIETGSAGDQLLVILDQLGVIEDTASRVGAGGGASSSDWGGTMGVYP